MNGRHSFLYFKEDRGARTLLLRSLCARRTDGRTDDQVPIFLSVLNVRCQLC